MTFKESIENVISEIRFRKNLHIWIVILNGLVAVFIGAFIDNIPTENQLLWKATMILLIVIFVVLSFLIIKLNGNDKNVEFLTELKATQEVNLLENLNSLLIDSINSLNVGTCQLQDHEKMCDTDIKTNLENVTSPLTNVFTNYLGTDFSIGVYFKDFCDPNQDNTYSIKSKTIFLFNDPLEINKLIPENLMEKDDKTISGFEKLMYQKISFCLSDDFYIEEEISSETLRPEKILNPFKIYLRFIPDMCNVRYPNTEGVIFIVTNNQNESEVRLDQFFEIFGWILSNYIEQFNNCVINKSDGIKNEADT